MKAIEVNNLHKKYKETTALNGISFEVDEGECFAYLGENGAGKSTTINILSTILEKTAGDVKVLGARLGVDDAKIRENIGIVFQNSVLDAKLTVKENLYTRGSYYGYTKSEITKRLSELGGALGLDEIMNRRYEKLSGGQRRRVDIVRALINKPRLLFLDEPTTGLDPMSRKLVWDYIDYLRKEAGLTIFLTTHYMEETRDADNVIIIDHGRLIAKGTPNELKSKHTSNRFVWYTGEAEESRILLRQNGFSERIDYEKDHYNVSFAGDITEFLYKNRERITNFEIIKGTMDDVFLNLTGKELNYE
ncbi:MAG: ABC transporter ATP-binding protein [Lachnospiraceae bacterium]|nr:ABC transporter ATP-binding protein [Lachnospiraceae bacterium]